VRRPGSGRREGAPGKWSVATGACMLPLVAGCASFHEAPDDASTPRDAAAASDAGGDGRRVDAPGTNRGDARRDEADATSTDGRTSDSGVTAPLWTAEVSGVFSLALNAVWGSSATDVYAVGASGTVVHSTGGGVWTTQTTPFAIGDFYSVWGSSATDVYAVTTIGDVCHSTGDGSWSCATVAEDLTAIWGPGPAARYVVSDLGVITKLSGASTAVTEEDSHAAFGLFGIWGSSAGDLYASADNGEVLHSAGDGVWTAEPGGQPGAGGTLWGSGARDVYLAGGTTLYHSTGDGTWTSQPAPTTVPLGGVWGSGATDVYAAGGQGTVLHSKGDGQWAAQPTGSSADLYAVWGSGAGDIYVVGDSGAILHRTAASN